MEAVVRIAIFASVLGQCAHMATSQLFQCQRSTLTSLAGQSLAVIYTPNIPDSYFNHAALNGNGELTLAIQGVTYIFTMPSLSGRRNCSGTLMGIQYCYRVDSTSNQRINVFEYLSGTLNGNVFTVLQRLTVTSTPSTNICRTIANARDCCDTFFLPERIGIQIPQESYTFGVKSSDQVSRRLYRFNPTVTRFHVSQYQTGATGNSIALGTPLGDRSFHLMRLLIEDPEATTTTTQSSTQPTTAITSQPVTTTTTTTTTTKTQPPPSQPVTTTTTTTITTSTTTTKTQPPPATTSTGQPGTTQPDTTQPTSSGKPVIISTSQAFTAASQPDVTTTRAVGGAVGGAVVGVIACLLCVVVAGCVVLLLMKRWWSQRRGSMDPVCKSTTEVTYENDGECGLGRPQLAFTMEKRHSLSNSQPGEYEHYEVMDISTFPKSLSNIMYEEVCEYNEEIYVAPSTDEGTLQKQLQTMKMVNLDRNSVQIGCRLGSGQFGKVFKGMLEGMDVAIKTLKEGSQDEDRVKFLQEAAIMGQFKHPNVVTMYGVVISGEPILLVLELLSKSDLRNHLLHMRSADEKGGVGVDDHTLLSYCRQVASGMAYLSGKAFVHRDLAARNILVSDDETCKIADFGMSRDLLNEDYYISHGGKIPVKWTAPEALHYKKYSTASDVWSYGALMYEIWSVGHKPFENHSNNTVMRLVDTGSRLPPPPGCPRNLYTIMILCWHPVTSERPTFLDISRQLSLPDTKLLKWTEEDKSAHPEAAQLGADLRCGEGLYKDLQTYYKGASNRVCLNPYVVN